MYSRFKKIIILFAIIAIVFYIAFLFIGMMTNSYSPNWHTWKQYTWIISNNVKSELDTNSCYSFVGKRDIYNNFNFSQNYNIVFWEFKDCRDIKLKNVNINANVYLNDTKFKSGEILNKDSDLQIDIKKNHSFNNIFNINLNEGSKIESYISGSNFKGFYGFVKRIVLSNNSDKDQIRLNYVHSKTPTILLVYKGHKSFFLIIINNITWHKSLNQDIIKILNLK